MHKTTSTHFYSNYVFCFCWHFDSWFTRVRFSSAYLDVSISSLIDLCRRVIMNWLQRHNLVEIWKWFNSNHEAFFVPDHWDSSMTGLPVLLPLIGRFLWEHSHPSRVNESMDGQEELLRTRNTFKSRSQGRKEKRRRKNTFLLKPWELLTW